MTTMFDVGNKVAAKAVQLCRPEVIAAYPITPQTVIVEELARMVETGELSAEYLRVESEHSVMASTCAAASMGIRTFTATSSQGLAFMHEMLHWASLSRLPIVMINVNRALGPGWSIWVDETDSLSQRDTGWIQIYCSTAQEIFDTIIQSFKLAEHRDVQLPVMINFSAFTISHTMMPVEIVTQEDVDSFLPPFHPYWKLDWRNPVTFGNVLSDDYYMEKRFTMQQGMERAVQLIPEIAREYEQRFGRYHGGLIEEYLIDDAEFILLATSAVGSEAKVAVDNLRQKGYNVGLARLRVFRPFPVEALRNIGQGRSFIVLDRNISVGSGGIVYHETRSAVMGVKGCRVYGYLAGVGGRDVTYEDIEGMALQVVNGAMDPDVVGWWDLKT
ncbi:MAG: pyruvate ferredoxin oxidoreductase, partial [Dehalococcoidia bacterium]|nr:pyruvate ferredoxin oxidoreductase [Dehalococcoidia bacterium]